MWTRCKIVLFVVSLAIQGCALLPRFPRITSIDKFVVEKNTNFNLISRVDAHVYNPNWFGFRVYDLKYKAYVGMQYLGRGQIHGPVQVAAHDTIELKQQKVIICYRNFRDILQSRPQLDSLPVTFLIKAQMNISPLVPVFYVKTLWIRPGDFLRASVNTSNIEQLLSISSIKINFVNYQTSKLSVVLTLKNDFPLDYEIDSVRLTIFDRFNQKIGNVKLGQKHVPQFTHIDLPFSILLDNINMAISLYGQSLEEEIIFFAQGKMYITIQGQHFTLPINERMGLEIEWLD